MQGRKAENIWTQPREGGETEVHWRVGTDAEHKINNDTTTLEGKEGNSKNLEKRAYPDVTLNAVVPAKTEEKEPKKYYDGLETFRYVNINISLRPGEMANPTTDTRALIASTEYAKEKKRKWSLKHSPNQKATETTS